jgi:hypothetical protein
VNEESVKSVPNLEEMQKRYHGEWLLIAYTELDDDLNPVGGEVIVHSPDRDVVYQALSQQPGGTVAIEYVGPFPEDLATAL